jgi:hypothetical protein
MKLTLRDLSFLPSDEALAELHKAWAWFLPKTFKPIMASTLGDIFFQQDGEAIFWLNTGTAEITQVAKSHAEFLEILKTEKADEWFMPGLIQQLKDAGNILKPDYCYTYVTLPIFKEGKYEASNLNPVPVKEHFGITGTIHHQIREVPDGGRVKIKIVE